MLFRFRFGAVIWNFLGTARMCKVWPGAVVAACIMFAWIIQHAFFGFHGLVFLISRVDLSSSGAVRWRWKISGWPVWLVLAVCRAAATPDLVPSVSLVFSPVDFLKFCLPLSLPSSCPVIIPTQPLRIVRSSVSFWNWFCHLYNNL